MEKKYSPLEIDGEEFENPYYMWIVGVANFTIEQHSRKNQSFGIYGGYYHVYPKEARCLMAKYRKGLGVGYCSVNVFKIPQVRNRRDNS